tara:strand:- start:470 stop:658 length:189 start_codon:yes stop_codon:yes gene_type:complete
MNKSNFEAWCDTVSNDLYEDIEFLMMEGAMTAEDVFCQVHEAFTAGYNSGVLQSFKILGVDE